MSSDVKLNAEIRSIFKNNDDRVRLVSDTGEQLGIVAFIEAMNAAGEKNLDLVLITETADPPVCKLLDYGKYAYEQKKKQKEIAKRARETAIEVKEIQLRPNIDTHDLDIKAKRAKEFLAEGDKVRIVLRFRGREMSHMTMGRGVMDALIAQLGDYKMEKPVEQTGNSLIAIMTPGKK